MSEIPVDGYVTVDPESTRIREPFVFVHRVEGLLREARRKAVQELVEKCDYCGGPLDDAACRDCLEKASVRRKP